MIRLGASKYYSNKIQLQIFYQLLFLLIDSTLNPSIHLLKSSLISSNTLEKNGNITTSYEPYTYCERHEPTNYFSELKVDIQSRRVDLGVGPECKIAFSCRPIKLSIEHSLGSLNNRMLEKALNDYILKLYLIV